MEPLLNYKASVLFTFFIPLLIVSSVHAGNFEKGFVERSSSSYSLKKFIFENIDNLSKEIALGQGETLNILAELMEIPLEERGAFFQNLRAHYDTIFPSKDVTPAEVFNNIIAVTLAK
ncbi:MAG: DUF3015 family protein [Nitrospirae bacterium]|nr:DUF3015 family protein [Nitrospirota bacterium]MBI3594818.1 DUF3015 family protein [Nitrospirota bacterium]